MKSKPRIFISYAREDRNVVDALYNRLFEVGYNPWIDTKDLLPGEVWQKVLIKAIREASVFLACLSKNSINKRGILQKEIKEALDVFREKLDTDIFVIPVRLEECQVPDSLSKFQWVDFFEDEGFWKLSEAIREALERLKNEQVEIPTANPSEQKRRREIALLLIDEITINLDVLRRTRDYLSTLRSDIDNSTVDLIFRLVGGANNEIYQKHYGDLDSFPIDIRRLINGHYRNLRYVDSLEQVRAQIDQMKSVNIKDVSEDERLLMQKTLISLLEGRITALTELIGGTEKLQRILETQL